MRRLLTFDCAGDTLVATLDDGPAATGLLIVSGGNEVRIGAHRGMAILAAAVAVKGYPVFRFDRRGIGDSTGLNHGFSESATDIAAAAAAFRRAAPHVSRIVAFGNCDAAAALVLFHATAGIDRLILANPWSLDAVAETPPAAAIRSRYAQRLISPAQWLRLIRGGVDLAKLAQGLGAAIPRSRPLGTLATRLAKSLGTAVPTTIVLAMGDNTAAAFLSAWRHRMFRPVRAKVALLQHASSSHSFAPAADAEWLRRRVLDALAD